MFSPLQTQSGRSFPLTVGMLGAAALGTSVLASSILDGNPLGLAWLKSSPPRVTFSDAPAGLGAQPAALVVSAFDDVAGLSRLTVSISQNGTSYPLAERSYERGGTRSEELSVQIDPVGLQLSEGTATVTVTAVDRSALRNSVAAKKDLTVSFAQPRVSALSAQQNGAVGGAELVVFRYVGRPPASSGVESSQGALYRSFPLAQFDSGGSFPESAYFSLFPIPYNFVPGRDTLRLVATDDFGNSSAAPFNYRIAPRSFPAVEWDFRMMSFSGRSLHLSQPATGFDRTGPWVVTEREISSL